MRWPPFWGLSGAPPVFTHCWGLPGGCWSWPAGWVLTWKGHYSLRDTNRSHCRNFECLNSRWRSYFQASPTLTSHQGLPTVASLCLGPRWGFVTGVSPLLKEAGWDSSDSWVRRAWKEKAGTAKASSSSSSWKLIPQGKGATDTSLSGIVLLLKSLVQFSSRFSFWAESVVILKGCVCRCCLKDLLPRHISLERGRLISWACAFSLSLSLSLKPINSLAKRRSWSAGKKNNPQGRIPVGGEEKPATSGSSGCRIRLCLQPHGVCTIEGGLFCQMDQALAERAGRVFIEPHAEPVQTETDECSKCGAEPAISAPFAPKGRQAVSHCPPLPVPAWWAADMCWESTTQCGQFGIEGGGPLPLWSPAHLHTHPHGRPHCSASHCTSTALGWRVASAGHLSLVHGHQEDELGVPEMPCCEARETPAASCCPCSVSVISVLW